MNKKRKAGAKPVTRVDVWIETQTCKDGSTSKTVAPIMGQVKQLNSAQTRRLSRHTPRPIDQSSWSRQGRSYSRGVGSTVSRTQVLASIPARVKLAELEKERNAKDQTINVLKSDVEYHKSTVADIKDWCTGNQHGSSCSQHEAASTSSVAATPAPNDCNFSNNVLYRLLDSQRKVAAHGQVIVQDVPLAVHGISLGDDEVKVRILKVFLPGSPLTSPNSFARTIGEVGVGGYAIWLKHRVASKPMNDKI